MTDIEPTTYDEAVQRVHRAFCDPDHELVSEWDQSMADALRRTGYRLILNANRAIAIVEESRQTHVRWAAWRRKGNDIDKDHELIGDLEWHEAAIRNYDYVLAVLRGEEG